MNVPENVIRAGEFEQVVEKAVAAARRDMPERSRISFEDEECFRPRLSGRRGTNRRQLLFVSEGDQINVRTPPNGGGKKFRALDKATGKTLWETELPAGSTGTPMTYQHGGKQYIVLAIGGRGFPSEFIAFKLPGGEAPEPRRRG